MIPYINLDDATEHGNAACDLRVPNMNGYLCLCPARFTAMFAQASVRWGVPLALLLVQCAQESAFNPSAQSGDGGYGLGQWTYEPAARQYLGVGWGDWHPAALDPARSIPATAHFMADLRQQMGSWHGALAGYNGGPNGENIPAAHAYADGIMGQSMGFEPPMSQAFGPVPPPPPPPQFKVVTDQWLRSEPDAEDTDTDHDGDISRRLINVPVGAIVVQYGAGTPHWLWVTYRGTAGWLMREHVVPA